MRIILSVLLFIPLLVSSQVESERPIVAEGNVPKDFLMLSSEIHKEDNSVDKSDKGFEKRAKKDFVESNSYTLHDLLYSGNVIFNDEITVYLNKVADKVFIKKPELRKKLRFYTMKSSEVNAFATHNGIIFITTGLLSQLETEAQLAFVLCHEAVHFEEKHNITKYVESQEIIFLLKCQELLIVQGVKTDCKNIYFIFILLIEMVQLRYFSQTWRTPFGKVINDGPVSL